MQKIVNTEVLGEIMVRPLGKEGIKHVEYIDSKHRSMELCADNFDFVKSIKHSLNESFYHKLLKLTNHNNIQALNKMLMDIGYDATRVYHIHWPAILLTLAALVIAHFTSVLFLTAHSALVYFVPLAILIGLFFIAVSSKTIITSVLLTGAAIGIWYGLSLFLPFMPRFYTDGNHLAFYADCFLLLFAFLLSIVDFIKSKQPPRRVVRVGTDYRTEQEMLLRRYYCLIAAIHYCDLPPGILGQLAVTNKTFTEADIADFRKKHPDFNSYKFDSMEDFRTVYTIQYMTGLEEKVGKEIMDILSKHYGYLFDATNPFDNGLLKLSEQEIKEYSNYFMKRFDRLLSKV